MPAEFLTIQVQGKSLQVPNCAIDGKTVITGGGWIKTASVMDEEFLEGEVILDPEDFFRRLSES